MAAASSKALSSYVGKLLFFLLQLGCFVFSSTRINSSRPEPYRTTRTHKRKSRRTNNDDNDDDDGSSSSASISSRFSRPSKKLITSSWSFIKRVFSSSSSTSTHTQTNPFTSSRGGGETTTTTTITGTTDPFYSPNLIQYSNNSSRSSNLSDNSSTTNFQSEFKQRKRRASRTESSIDFSYGNHHPLVRNNDIYPCSSCGEIFYRVNRLEQHQILHHAVSELHDDDPGKNIVLIIFKTGWPSESIPYNIGQHYSYYNGSVPMIHRILKIQNSDRMLSRFEEYRETVKMKAGNERDVDESVVHERCMVDGNEMLRFHCTSVVCGIGEDGEESVCGHEYCSLCGIIKSGFSMKLDDGISTSGTSLGAHNLSVNGDLESEFGFMCVKRAMLVCRVVAGRVGYDMEKGSVGFDSVVVSGDGRSGGGGGGLVSADEELLVFNPRAVLPCFVIVYSI